MKMISIMLIVISATLYQVFAKGVAAGVNPFAALTITYIGACALSMALFLLTSRGASYFAEVRKLNISSLLLGFSICFYELGYVLAYRGGWTVGKLQPVVSVFSLISLTTVAMLVYKEHISALNLAGLAIVSAGILITMK